MWHPSKKLTRNRKFKDAKYLKAKISNNTGESHLRRVIFNGSQGNQSGIHLEVITTKIQLVKLLYSAQMQMVSLRLKSDSCVQPLDIGFICAIEEVWTILPATGILGFILKCKKNKNLSAVYQLFQPLVVGLDQQSVSNGMSKITFR